METITIQKQELKNLIKETISEAIHKEFEKVNYPFVSDEEMTEIEAQHSPNPKENTEYIRL